MDLSSDETRWNTPSISVGPAAPVAERTASLIAAIVGLFVTCCLLGFQNLAFNQPVKLSGDHVWLLEMIKQSMNGVSVFDEHLGAPSHQTLYYFPFFDGSYKALIWILSRFTSNVFLVANLFYLAGVPLIFITSFWALRILNVGPLLASAASVAFIMSPYFATRVYGHDLLVLYYSVPMGATLALWMSEGDPLHKLLTPFGLCAVLLIGTSGFYYAFFSAMFLGLSMTGASFAQRSIRPLLICAVLAIALVFLLLFSAYGYHMWHLFDAAIPTPPSRFRWEQFYHGLLIANALQAYNGIGLFLKQTAEIKATALPLIGEGLFPEWPGIFLTTIILAAPITLFPLLQMRNPRYRLIALCLAFITFGLVFASRGGLGSILAFVITPAVRAQERILPFLSFFAIIAACLGCELIRQRGRRIVASMLVACAMLTGIYPAINILSKRQADHFRSSQTAQDNFKSVKDVLAAKDASRMTTVFQFPVMAWLEAPAIEGLWGGGHLLPYLLDHAGSKTRWSYGLNAKEISPFEAMTAVDTEIPAKLKTIGFDGILVEKTGYKPDRAIALIKSLEDNGACLRHEDQFRALLAVCR